MGSKTSGNFYKNLKKTRRLDDELNELKKRINGLQIKLEKERNKPYNRIINELIDEVDRLEEYKDKWKNVFEEVFRRAKELVKINMMSIDVFNALFDQPYSRSDDTLRLLFGQYSSNVDDIRKKIGRAVVIPRIKDD